MKREQLSSNFLMNYHVHGRSLGGFCRIRDEAAWVMEGRTPFRAIVLLHFAALLHEPHALNFLFTGNHFFWIQRMI